MTHTHRNATVDIARGIGIVLVVLGHNGLVLENKGELFRVIYAFHLPLFFFLSGLFLKDTDTLRKFALSRADALLKPYFVVLALAGILMALEPDVVPTADASAAGYFFGVLYATAPTIAWAPLWFLPHLFVASVVSMAILRATRTARNRSFWLGLIASALLAAGIHCMGRFWQTDTGSLRFMGLDHLPGLPWSLDLTFISSACILWGFLLRRQVMSLNFSTLRFLVAAFAFALLHYRFNETMDLNLRIYGDPLIATLQAVLGIYMVLSVSSLLQRYAILQRPLTYIGSGSLLILVFHPVAQGRAALVLARVTHNDYVAGALSLAAGIMLPLLILEAARRQRFLAVWLLPRKFGPPKQVSAASATKLP
ncbi:acyltransferase family protein [Polaromonas sp.]|uniref:acyltransferase family protein n=1 Tax=Polaromonas sp. TaxID=1869339 RepID=UPI0032658C05